MDATVWSGNEAKHDHTPAQLSVTSMIMIKKIVYCNLALRLSVTSLE